MVRKTNQDVDTASQTAQAATGLDVKECWWMTTKA